MSHMHNSRKYRKKRNQAQKRELRAAIRMIRRSVDARQMACGVTAFRTKQTKGHDPTDLTVEWFRGFCQ